MAELMTGLTDSLINQKRTYSNLSKMMDLLINELSFDGQGRNVHRGSELMQELIALVLTFKKLPQSGRVFSNSTFYSRRLSNRFTVLDSLKALNKSIEKQVFFEIVTKGPYIDVLLDRELPNHSCSFNSINVTNSSLAGAAYLSGLLASLNDLELFQASSIVVSFSRDGSAFVQHDLENFCNEASITEKLRRKYAASPKHQPGGHGTLMDLSPTTAEMVLNIGVLGPNRRQIYGYCDGKLYEFQSDNAGTFHGYPVTGNEVPHQVLQEMHDSEMITTLEYRRFLSEGPP